MSNTRICDVEIAEKRFPLLVREFSIRRGSGGTGQYRGGDGVIREYEARVDMMVSTKHDETLLEVLKLTGQASHIGERRVVPAYGLHGGKPGGKGATFWKRKMNGEERVLRTKPACSFK
jgi:5-oxoprolinase (ATP-hydrolysing)